MMPKMCTFHASVYATRLEALRYAIRRPGHGRKALAREAATVAGQCRECGAA